MAMEMINRLEDLRGGNRGWGPDLEPEPGELDAGDEFALESFFSTVDDLSRNISEIAQRNVEIKEVQNNIITKPASANKLDKEKHTQLMDEVKKLSQRVHKGLKRLEEEIKTEEQGPSRHTAEFRIKKGQYSALAHQLKQVMLEYNALEEQHRDRCKNLIKRQMQAVDPHQEISDDKVDDMLESQDISVFTQDILIQSAQKRQALDEVESRKKEILALEENIMELHDMFYDMMLLVEEQGDLVDQIEHNVTTAAIYVQKGAEETRKAVTYKRSNRRLKWIICGIVTAVIIAIVLALALIIGLAVGLTPTNVANMVSDRSPESTPEPFDELEGDQHLTKFLGTIQGLAKDVAAISAKNNEIREVQRNVIAKLADANEADKEKHAQLMADVKKISQRVHMDLKKLEEEIKQEECGPSQHSMLFRVKKAQFMALARQLDQVMVEHRHLEELHRDHSKTVVKRILQGVDPSRVVTDELIEEMLDAKDFSALTADILVQGSEKRHCLNELESRKKEILALEESILELYDMMVDMKTMVEEQGDLMDSVQFYLTQAKDYVHEGAEQVASIRSKEYKPHHGKDCVIS